MRKFTFLFLQSFLIYIVNPLQAQKIDYRISFIEPHTHYAEVEMQLSGWAADTLEVRMPVWAPGSYLVREFSRHVESFSAQVADKPLIFKKTTKNAWQVYGSSQKDVVLKYRVYANELSVRTSHIDDSHAYLNGTSVFMYLKGYKEWPVTLKVVPFHTHKQLSTALKATADDPYLFVAENYDDLADAPIEIGNQEIIKFDALGIPHELCMVWNADYDRSKLSSDFRKIIEEATSIYGLNPVKRYVTIIHHFPGASGGLEHKNSTTLQINPSGYKRNYHGVLSLFAHEYFHVWNVKRLRPQGLGPFDYDQEVYTDLLWFSEGFTSYYDELIPLRAGLSAPADYLKSIESLISKVERSPGNEVMTLAESSFDTWIKFYRRDENSGNSQISYYDKGHLAGMLLNAWIINETRGEYALDDLMKSLYQDFVIKDDRGFTESDIKNALEKICGKVPEAFFKQVIHGTETIPYALYLEPLGVKFEWKKASKAQPRMGAMMNFDQNKVVVRSVEKGSIAYVYGLNSGDEIMFVNGKSAGQHWAHTIDQWNGREPLKLIISRREEKKELTLNFKEETRPMASIHLNEKLSPLQKKMLGKWMGKAF